MSAWRHKYVFYVYPVGEEKHGRFFFCANSLPAKKRLREQNLKFDFKKNILVECQVTPKKGGEYMYYLGFT